MSVVDVWDALSTARPYKPAYPMEKALRIMTKETDRGWWDREVFEVFRRMVEKEGFGQQREDTESAPVRAAHAD